MNHGDYGIMGNRGIGPPNEPTSRNGLALACRRLFSQQYLPFNHTLCHQQAVLYPSRSTPANTLPATAPAAFTEGLRDEGTPLLGICQQGQIIRGPLPSLISGTRWPRRFPKYAGRPYSHTLARRRADAFVKARREKLREYGSNKDGVGGDGEYMRLVDAWIKIVDAEERQREAAITAKKGSGETEEIAA